ncbi:unnamed protein product [Rotaria sordida]|uniref:Uncharacterized protein n=1 Tax=Rotaria sordida TaxID=392033 RepID=A0A814YET8_9BILA|nr:unnamed protein product [Rotaria sordida]CAF1229393.1 unnamed protein product [Rotaria sordida]
MHQTRDATGAKANTADGDIERYHEELFEIAQTGDIKRLKDLLDELDRHKDSTTKKELLNMGYQSVDNLTVLSVAAGKKHKSITEILAKCPEVDVNKASLSGITPLLMVAEVGWPDILDILLQRCAIVDPIPSGKRAEEYKIAGSTPLIGATKYNNSECVKCLLEYHANPNHQNHFGISALMLAAEQGYFECVKLLIQAGADIDLAPSGPLALIMNIYGQTPLFCAAKEGRTDIVKYLLDRGANPSVQNHYGISALWIPSQRGMLKVVELLLNAGAETHVAPFGNQTDKLNITGWTSLYVAMKSRKFDVVKLLLKYGADPNAITKYCSTPFLLASEICDLDIIEACIEAGADLDFAPSGSDADNLNITGQTALFMATLKDRINIVKFLIEKGAQVNIQNRYGVSPLLLCSESGNRELVQTLIEAGANVNITPQGELAEENFLVGQTPLFVAAKKGHVEICEYLIQNGADVNAVTMTGATPLYTAIEEDHLEVVVLLIRCGADVNQSLKVQIAHDLQIENQTPLFCACAKGFQDIVEYLIEQGADVNGIENTGQSCLHIAAAMGYADIVRILCERGANIDQQFHFEGQNLTAYDLAKFQQHDDVCQILKSFNARQ